MIITFDLDAISSRSKKQQTVEGYLKSRKSVDKYVDIMAYIDPSNKNFQDKFSEFYGLNAARDMNKKAFYDTFAEYYNHTVKYVTYRNILQSLKSPFGTGRLEVSFGSKILHTIDCDEPIIDKQVIKQLRSCPYTAKYFLGIPKSIDTIDKAVNLYFALKACYFDCLIPCAKMLGYFDEFDRRFPSAKDISEVKKIDFYLWAM